MFRPQRPAAAGWIAAAALTGACATATAGPDLANVLAASDGIKVATVSPHKLVKTYISTGSGGGSALTGGGIFNVINTRTIECPAVTGCTIGAEASVQVNPGGHGHWGPCVRVNGSYVTCPVQGLVPHPTTTFVVGHLRASTGVVVPQGSHTVETGVFVTNASNLYIWEVNYRVYKP